MKETEEFLNKVGEACIKALNSCDKVKEYLEEKAVEFAKEDKSEEEWNKMKQGLVTATMLWFLKNDDKVCNELAHRFYNDVRKENQCE